MFNFLRKCLWLQRLLEDGEEANHSRRAEHSRSREIGLCSNFLWSVQFGCPESLVLASICLLCYFSAAAGEAHSVWFPDSLFSCSRANVDYCIKRSVTETYWFDLQVLQLPMFNSCSSSPLRLPCQTSHMIYKAIPTSKIMSVISF